MTDRPPQSIGRYKLLDRISIGGMAEIFRAKATGHGGFEKLVALKRILPHMADDQEFVDMFIDEAHTVAQLSHANICQMFEFGQEEGIYFIALELVEGKDLKRIMEYHRIRNRPMPANVAIYIVCRICEALDYAHHCLDSAGRPMNIVHRDVSPQNILVSYGGDVKLIDFGIAKAVGRLTKTCAGSIKGKFGYMSPEQVSGKPVDLRSDIFACGTILYELVANDRLFKAETDIATMQLVRKAAFRPLSSVVPRAPPGLDPILLRALSREPEQRYAVAGDLLDDLERLAVQTGQTCSAQHLSRWINEVFAADRKRAEARAREAERIFEERSDAGTRPGRPAPQLVEAEPAPPPSLAEVSGPALPRLPESSVTGPALPAHLGTITGQGTVSATFTQTAPPRASSRQPWILVLILSLALLAGATAVAVLWPRQRGPKIVTIPAARTQPRARTEALAPEHATARAGARGEANADGSAARPPERARAPEQRKGRTRRGRGRGRAVARGPATSTSPVDHPTPPGGPGAAAPPGARTRGLLIIASKPWARVWIDGVDTGRNTPIPLGAPLRLTPGPHEVTLYVASRRHDFSVVVKAGEVTRLIRTLPSPY